MTAQTRLSTTLRRPAGYAARFWQHRGGNAAVEFGFIAPLIAALFIGVIDVSKIAYDRTDMYSATRSGAQYFMSGGSDLDRARAIVADAWTEAPDDAVVTVSRYCECGGVSATCHQTCPDSSPPDVFAEIKISAIVNGIITDYQNATTDVVRIR